MSATSSSLEHAIGSFVVLSVALPGMGFRPMGVIVWDRQLDKIHISQRSFDPERDEDVAIVWQEFGNMLQEVAHDAGGYQALEWLESTASHTVRVSVREPLFSHITEGLSSRLLEQVACSEETNDYFSEGQIEAARLRSPIMASVAIQVLSLLSSSYVGVSQLESLLSRDPILVGKIIQAANTGSIHLREPARTLNAAIQRLGFDSIRLLTVGLTVAKAFAPLELRNVWEHSLAVAQLARRLAPQAGLPAGEVALLALVHDIGKVTLNSLGPDYIAECERLRTLGVPDIFIEQELTGHNHAELGADLLKLWGFPAEYCIAVRHHHSVSNSDSKYAALLMTAEAATISNEDCWSIHGCRSAALSLGLNRWSASSPTARLDPDLAFLQASA